MDSRIVIFNCLTFQWIQLPFFWEPGTFRYSFQSLYCTSLVTSPTAPPVCLQMSAGSQWNTETWKLLTVHVVIPDEHVVDTLPTLIWDHFYWGVLMRNLVLDLLKVNVQRISGLPPSTCPVVLLFIAMRKEIRKCCIFIKNTAHNLIISKDYIIFICKRTFLISVFPLL